MIPYFIERGERNRNGERENKGERKEKRMRGESFANLVYSILRD